MAQPKQVNPRVKQAAIKKQLRYTIISRMAKALSNEFSLISNFKLGYRNKEDISTLPAYVLAIGSQNVLTNEADQIVVRNGYQLDGPASTQTLYGTDSGYDFNTHINGIQNLRKWGPNLEVRYANPVTSAVTWPSILNSLSPTNVCNFTAFWEGTKNVCLFVNGTFNIYRWTGGIGSFLSATTNTITLSGTQSLVNLNFDPAGTLLIDGVTYSYTSAGIVPNVIFNQTPVLAQPSLSQAMWHSQMFTTGAAATQITTAVTSVKSTSITNGQLILTGAIYTDNAGIPGTLVGGAQAVVGTPTGSNSPGNFTFTFTYNALTVAPSTNYHFVVSQTSTQAGLEVNTGSSSGTGTNVTSNSGATWTTENGYLNLVVTENDSNTITFNGVTPDPTLASIAVGDAVIQAPTVFATTITGVSGFTTYDLIDTFRNQVYYGSFGNQTVYISKVNNALDCSFSSPRVVGEGASVTLDAPPTAFIAQSDGEYMSAGLAFWYRTKFTLSADLSDESFEIDRLKTSSRQSAVTQAYVSKYKNSIVYVSYENIFNSLGPVRNILADPQVINMSDSIKYDMDAYTFGTGGSTHYNSYNLYFSVPAQGVVRVYNISKKYWEAPQTMPVGIFYEVNGLLYGHDATTNQSYQLFVPNLYRDNESPTFAVAAFPYVSAEGAKPDQKKFFNKHYTEGYIAGNTTLTLQFNYDFGGYAGTYSVGISGADKRIVFNKITDGSLGQNPLGSQPIGTILNLPNQPPIPKFRIINTFAPTNSFEVQTVYSSYDLDASWAILRFGPAIGPARDMPVEVQE